MAVCAFSTGANSQPKGATLKWFGILLVAVLIAGCGSDTQETPKAAREHPDWSPSVNRCIHGLVDARDAAEWGSVQWMLGSDTPSMAEARRDVCEQMAECQWQETGTPAVEFTVASKSAYEDCYRLVFSRLNSRLN